MNNFLNIFFWSLRPLMRKDISNVNFSLALNMAYSVSRTVESGSEHKNSIAC